MSPDGLDFNLHNILEGRDNEELELFQRLSAFFQDIGWKTAVSIDAYLVQQKENEHKQDTVNKNIAKLHKVKKDSKGELEQIILQRKVTEKKIAIANNQRSRIEEEINDAKLKKESISLEMVELNQDIEDARKHRIDRWNAIKKACSYYKDNLDIRVNLEQSNDRDQVKLTFFGGKSSDGDNYYVILEKLKNNWRVERIEPALKETHLEETKASIDLTKPLDIRDTTAFLYRLRNTFLKYYSKR